MRRLVPFVELLPGGAGRSWGFLSDRSGAGGAGGAVAAGGAVGGELLLGQGGGAPGEVTFLGVALSGVTVNQAELMESDEHLRWILEQIEIAKGEQEAAEAASAALKQPEAHRTPLHCYKRQQIPMPENAEVSDELQAWLQACSLFVTPREWLRMLQLRYLAITPMLQENFEELSAAERRPYEEESMLDLRRYHTACEEHTASKEAAQKLCFEKNKLVARYCASLKKERASNAIAHADVAADAAAAAAAAAAAVPPPP